MKLRYGNSDIEVFIPEKNICFDMEPNKIDSISDIKQAIKNAVNNPIGCEPLGFIVQRGSNVVIVSDDNTRLTPAYLIIPVILEILNNAGIPDKQIKLIISSGSHPAMSYEEKIRKYGSEVLNRIPVIHHNYTDDSMLVNCGITSNGIDIWINKYVYQADIIIGIGSIIPHWPAGFGGGGKIILPGVAGQKSIDKLHLIGILDGSGGLGIIEGNNFRKAIDDVAEKVGLKFIINTIFNHQGKIAYVVAGHYLKAFKKGVEYAKKIFAVEFNEKADVTISSTYPVDFDLFQVSKGIFSALLATKKGGEVILISKCFGGIPITHVREFCKLAGLSRNEIIKYIENSCVEDVVSATEILAYMECLKQSKVTIVSDGLEKYESILKKVGFDYTDNLQQKVNRILKVNQVARFGIIRQSAEILPQYNCK